MPRMFERFRGLFLFVILLSVSARVITGAAEAQVNFTSLMVDQHLVTNNVIDEHTLFHQSVLKSAEGVNSVPEKHRAYATYKKYITPDKSFAVEVTRSYDQSLTYERIGYKSTSHIHSSIFLPLANSPPIDASAQLRTHTSITDSSVVLENSFGEIEIDNSARRLGSFQL